MSPLRVLGCTPPRHVLLGRVFFIATVEPTEQNRAASAQEWRFVGSTSRFFPAMSFQGSARPRGSPSHVSLAPSRVSPEQLSPVDLGVVCTTIACLRLTGELFSWPPFEG